jgi:heptosyltransferase-2
MTDAAKRETMSNGARAILVFRSSALGDFILATPALRMLRQTYPDDRIVLLNMQSANKAIRASVARYSPTDRVPWVQLAMPHLVDEVVAMDVSLKPAYLWALRRQLRTFDFACAFLLLDPGAPWPGRIKKLLLIRFLLGGVPTYGWRARGSVNGNRAELHAAGRLRHHVHGSLQFMSELKPPRAYTEADIRFDLRPPAEALLWAGDWLKQNTPPDKRLVFVAPGSIQPHKRWPKEKFAALIAALVAEFNDLFFVIIGTPADHEIGEYLRQQQPHWIANIAGASTVAQSAALLGRPCLLVGNDGGAMHLGDAMGCRVVSIVPGLEYPDSIEPWNNRRFAVRHPAECAPCYSFDHCPQGHNRCMTELPLQHVLKNCVDALALL